MPFYYYSIFELWFMFTVKQCVCMCGLCTTSNIWKIFTPLPVSLIEHIGIVHNWNSNPLSSFHWAEITSWYDKLNIKTSQCCGVPSAQTSNVVPFVECTRPVESRLVQNDWKSQSAEASRYPFTCKNPLKSMTQTSFDLINKHSE